MLQEKISSTEQGQRVCAHHSEAGAGLVPDCFYPTASVLAPAVLAGPSPVPQPICSLFQIAANSLLSPSKEEFATAPLEIGSPSILLADSLAKAAAAPGIYLHLFAKAKPVPPDAPARPSRGGSSRGLTPWPQDSSHRVPRTR